MREGIFAQIWLGEWEIFVNFPRENLPFFWSHSRMRLFHDMINNLRNVFILNCVTITNINIEHYMEVVIR